VNYSVGPKLSFNRPNPHSVFSLVLLELQNQKIAFLQIVYGLKNQIKFQTT
jgi:hypothetical protein